MLNFYVQMIETLRDNESVLNKYKCFFKNYIKNTY